MEQLYTTFSTSPEVSSLLSTFCQVWHWDCSTWSFNSMLQDHYLPSHLSLPVFLTDSHELYSIFQPEHLQML